MRRRLFVIACIILSAFAIASAQTAGPELAIPAIMRGDDFIGHSPSEIRWSDDSKRVYFNWDPERTSSDSLYVVERSGGELRKVTLEEQKGMPSGRGSHNRDFTVRVYEKNGDLFTVRRSDGRIHQITNTVEFESDPNFTHDGSGITFVKGDNLYRWRFADGNTAQLTDFREGDERKEDKRGSDRQEWLKAEELSLMDILRRQKDKRESRKEREKLLRPGRPLEIYIQKQSVSDIELSPYGSFITFELADSPDDPEMTRIPNYVTEDGYVTDLPARPKAGSPEPTYKFGVYDVLGDSVYFLTVDSLPGIFTPPEYLKEYAQSSTLSDTEAQSKDDKPRAREVSYAGPVWSDDGRRALFDIRSQDFKDRWLATLDPVSGKLTVIDHQHDEAWIGGPGIGWSWSENIGWLADNRSAWFQSEASGYSHIYTVDVVSGRKTQRTSGAWEVSRLEISQDKKYWYFNANIDHPGDRQFYRLATGGGQPEKLTTGRGYHRVSLSPDQNTLAILYSSSARPPELYLQSNNPEAEARRVTDSQTEAFKAYAWREPELMQFQAEDGARVYARLYRPLRPTPKGPAVIFVHGAGYLQNAHNWWSYYDHEYMFHNFLADRGYTVLDIDYRGSAGYGRDWRTAIYRHMGGLDLTDQVDGARFLVQNYNVDSAHIGIYGGSYGGFITLMALFKHPGVFACGAALRSVTDWAHYNHGYTGRILNLPHTDSLAYVRSSPIYFAEGLQDALLMCHGMLDDNVEYQDIVRLTQRLIELGKDNWELASYPLESHSFTEPESWTDEYRRIFELFEEHLK